jgi:hypothetical protein
VQRAQARRPDRGGRAGLGRHGGYKRGEDRLTFFEIDPMVNRLSRDPKWFTYINGCSQQRRGPIDTVLGDARLTLAKQPAGTYDLLMIDAFSSDAVPTHLLTEEAIDGYLKLLKPTGVVMLHLSNRNLDITGRPRRRRGRWARQSICTRSISRTRTRPRWPRPRPRP